MFTQRLPLRGQTVATQGPNTKPIVKNSTVAVSFCLHFRQIQGFFDNASTATIKIEQQLYLELGLSMRQAQGQAASRRRRLDALAS
jgi:hypothetical protein